MMKYIFCQSYLHLAGGLSIIEKSLQENREDFIVVTANRDIITLITQLYGSNKIYQIPSYSMCTPISKRFALFFPLILFWRLKFKFLARRITGDEIYFFIEGGAYIMLSFIKELSKNNSVVYHRCNEAVYTLTKENLRQRLNRFIIKNFHSVDVEFVALGKSRGFRPTRRYFKDISAHEKEIPVQYPLISNRISQCGMVGADILLLGSKMSIEIFCKIEKSIKLYNSLLVKFNEYDVKIKHHPMHNMRLPIEEKYEEIPPYFPGMFIMGLFRIVVGYASAALYEAANIGCVAISLLNYLPANDENEKQDRRIYLEANLNEGKMIYYPESMGEILKLCNTHLIDNFETKN